ncbi:MAG: pentapeptide repeat-containing protein [Exilibacterium sp.]
MILENVLALLSRGSVAWNTWRLKNLSNLPCLDGLELEGMNLQGVDFSEMSMNGVRINRCNLKNAKFISTKLRNSDLRYNDFSAAKFIAAKLDKSDLSGSILTGVNFLTASVIDARLQQIDFRGHDLNSLNLRGTYLAGSNLEGQNLSKHDLTDVNLVGANLKHADLSNANLSNADLTGANLHSAQLRGANFKSANLHKLDLSGKDLEGINFAGAVLTDCNLRAANLKNANLSRADITGSQLWKIQSWGWDISGIKCDRVFWDEQGTEKTYYRKHEFERIYAEAIGIELRYDYRLTANEIATLPILIEHLEASHWGTILRLKSIQDVAGGAVVKLVVEETSNYQPSELRAELQMEAKDLKGFSKWANDELSEKLSLFRGLIKPVLNKWRADHPNMEGDSLRVTFRNATTALSCACMMRGVLTAAGFELRIGVDLGEVSVVHNEVTEQADLEGTAVSMAARLEAVSNTGEVLVTERVRHYTDHKGIFKFTPRKAKLAKSIGDKKEGDIIECYSVDMVKPIMDIG